MKINVITFNSLQTNKLAHIRICYMYTGAIVSCIATTNGACLLSYYIRYIPLYMHLYACMIHVRICSSITLFRMCARARAPVYACSFNRDGSTYERDCISSTHVHTHTDGSDGDTMVIRWW